MTTWADPTVRRAWGERAGVGWAGGPPEIHTSPAAQAEAHRFPGSFPNGLLHGGPIDLRILWGL